jgi:hypothetical protein
MPNFHDSQPLLIPKKEKELFVKSERSIQKNNSKSSNNHISFKNLIPYNDKINNNHVPSQSNKLHLDLNLEEDINNFSTKKKEIKGKARNNNIGNKKKIPNCKFIKIIQNKNKQDRATTCPVSYKTKKTKKIIDMNNCLPTINTKKEKVKYINNYEINKNNKSRNKEIFINKTLNDDIKNNSNKKFSSTKHSEEKRFNFNTMLESKLKMTDLSDDIIEVKPNCRTIDNDGNKLIVDKLKNEIDKTKQIIHILKNENEKLKIKLYYTERNAKKNKIKK